METADGPLDGARGVAVLMRYTLRLLTAQQFQRATALVCAAELARAGRSGDLGQRAVPDRAVGRHRREPEAVDEADEQLTKANESRRLPADRAADPALPVVRHAASTPAQSAPTSSTRRVHVYCGDDLAPVPVRPGGAVDEGLPVLTVDEEIYRLAPAFVIATVDKFARLAREGEAAALFGYVAAPLRPARLRPPRLPALRHQGQAARRRRTVHPAAAVRPGGPAAAAGPGHPGRAAPDHRRAGHHRRACSRSPSTSSRPGATATATPVRPLLVASTATVRNAPDQVRALYGRESTIFPPQVLDAGRHVLLPRGRRSPSSPRAGATSASAPRAFG